MHALKLVNTKRPFQELHDEVMAVSKDLKRHYLKLFELLLEVEERKIYQQFEITSLYVYCVELLELSPATAHDFVTVLRKSLEVAPLADAIRSGKLTISKARKICPVLTLTDYKQWIDLAQDCSCRIIEKAVALAKPREAVKESMKYVDCDVLEFKLAVSEEWSELLKRTKDLLSQQKCRAVSSEEALFILMKDHCRRNDPVEKAKRALMKAQKLETASTGEIETGNNVEINGVEMNNAKGDKLDNWRATEIRHVTNFKFKRTALPAAIKHAVSLRDMGQCTYVNRQGARCQQKRWIDMHHIIPVADGGADDLTNLVTLCFAHHRLSHAHCSRV